MLRYKIQKVKKDFELNIKSSNKAWILAQEISLSYIWDKFPYKPKVHVKCLYSDKFLYLRFEVEENAIQSTATKINDFVYIDSCVEFFCSPEPLLKNHYYNLEMNCCGNVFMAYGPDRKERSFVPTNVLENITSARTVVGATKKISVDDKKWDMEIKIPWAVYQSMSDIPVPTKGTIWKGNFYKCGDKLPKVHYGSWTKIELPAPDFHRPEFFGELVFE
jgi:hypothetical protein